MILMLAVTATLIGALGFAKFRQIQEGMAQAAAFQPPPEAVTTIVAKQSKWPDTLNAIGTIAAVQGVTVSADLPGIVERIDFESGASVLAGDMLVQLDTKQEQAQLAAVEADRDLARLNFERLKDLVEEGAISRAEYDRRSRRAEADGGKGWGNPCHDRAENDPGAVFGNPGYPAGQPRSVSVGGRCGGTSAVARSDLCEFRRAAAGCGADARWPQRSHHNCRFHRPRVRRTGNGDQLGSGRGDAEHSGSGHSCQPAKQAAARYVRSDRG